MILLEEFEQVQLIQDLDPEHLQKVAVAAELREFLENETIFRERELSSYTFIILEGEVELSFQTQAGKVPIQVLGSGDLLGWSSILCQGRMTATARAISRCRVAALNVRKLLEQFDDDPKFGLEFVLRVAMALALRLTATRRRLVDKPS
ncbi:MAG: cyclic nucleotide-binding domain-containing protein [Gemmataceae bacterium]